MKRCDNCGTVVMFGGERWGGRRFCCEACVQTAITSSYSEDIPEDIVMQHAMTLREGPCPQCGGEGPNDFHSAWSVFSFLIMTFHAKKEIFGCRWCGLKHKMTYFVFTGLFGWWGIPWGLLMTPFFEIANLFGMLRGVPADGPSEELKQLALTQLSEELRRRVEDDDDDFA